MEQLDNNVAIQRVANELNGIATRVEDLINENPQIFNENPITINNISNDNSLPDTSINTPPPPLSPPPPPPPSSSPPLTPDEVPMDTQDDQNDQNEQVGQDNIMDQNQEGDNYIDDYYVNDPEDRNFFTMIGTLIENRNIGITPIQFMTIMSQFIIDVNNAIFRIPRNQNNNNNNNNNNNGYEFDEHVNCAYCAELVTNDLNSYLQHIINANHIQEQINLNNAVLNSLQNEAEIENIDQIDNNIDDHNIEQNEEQIEDDIQEELPNSNNDVIGNNDDNNNDNNGQIINLTVNDIIDFVSHLTPDAMAEVNRSLDVLNHGDFDPETQDLNNSQEYKQELLDIIYEIYGNPTIVPLNHLNMGRIIYDAGMSDLPPLNDPNMPPFMNSLNQAIQGFMQVYGGNRFPAPQQMQQVQRARPVDDYSDEEDEEDEEDDGDGNGNYNPIRRSGLELSEHSTEYEIKYDTQCGICLETHKAAENTKFNILLCMHQYCNDCTKKWFEKNVICPNCKTDLRTLRAINLSEVGFGGF